MHNLRPTGRKQKEEKTKKEGARKQKECKGQYDPENHPGVRKYHERPQ